MDNTGPRWRRPKHPRQQTLFPPSARRASTHPRVDPAATSRAARSAVATQAESQRARILDFVESRTDHGATADEICERMAMLPQSVTPRLGELAREGLIVRSGRKRATRSGCAAHVWVAAGFIQPPVARG